MKRELTPVFVQQEPDTHCTQHNLDPIQYTADPATVKTSNKWNIKQMASNMADFIFTLIRQRFFNVSLGNAQPKRDVPVQCVFRISPNFLPILTGKGNMNFKQKWHVQKGKEKCLSSWSQTTIQRSPPC